MFFCVWVKVRVIFQCVSVVSKSAWRFDTFKKISSFECETSPYTGISSCLSSANSTLNFLRSVAMATVPAAYAKWFIRHSRCPTPNGEKENFGRISRFSLLNRSGSNLKKRKKTKPRCIVETEIAHVWFEECYTNCFIWIKWYFDIDGFNIQYRYFRVWFVLLVHLFVCFARVWFWPFFFLLMSKVGGLWLWHTLDLSFNFFTSTVTLQSSMTRKKVMLLSLHWKCFIAMHVCCRSTSNFSTMKHIYLIFRRRLCIDIRFLS